MREYAIESAITWLYIENSARTNSESTGRRQSRSPKDRLVEGQLGPPLF